MIRKSGLTNTHAASFSAGLLCSALGLFSMSYSTASHAAIFKCTDANGGVSYTQTPCPAAEQTQKVIANTQSNKPRVDCRIANNFARRTATQMRAGQSSGELFDAYGGIDALPKTAIGVINYVYSHKQNTDTGAQRISALSAARCSAGSYGPVSCDDFPYAFISEMGGCDQAKQMKLSPTLAEEQTQKTEQPVATAGTAALGVRTTSDDADNDCKRSIQLKISDLVQQMRNGHSAKQQSQLQDKKSELRNKLNNC